FSAESLQASAKSPASRTGTFPQFPSCLRSSALSFPSSASSHNKHQHRACHVLVINRYLSEFALLGTGGSLKISSFLAARMSWMRIGLRLAGLRWLSLHSSLS